MTTISRRPSKRPADDSNPMSAKKAICSDSKDSAVARTLVLPDIHMRCGVVDEILTALATRYDQIVLLGDYFDRPPTERGKPVSPADADAVVTWLRKSLTLPNRTHLVGNHDLSYFAPSNDTYCSGTTAATRNAIAQWLKPVDLHRFRAAAKVGPWLLSHAGFHVAHINGRDAASLVVGANADLESLTGIGGPFPSLLGCGYARFGSQRHGGVTWCDWDDEFAPVRNLNQIVGHTCEVGRVRCKYLRHRGRKVFDESFEIEPGGEVFRPKGAFDSMNWCIDTALEVVAIIESDGIRFVRWRKAT